MRFYKTYSKVGIEYHATIGLIVKGLDISIDIQFPNVVLGVMWIFTYPFFSISFIFLNITIQKSSI